MLCNNCGDQIPDEAKFCGGCGTPVEANNQSEIPEQINEQGAYYEKPEDVTKEVITQTVDQGQPTTEEQLEQREEMAQLTNEQTGSKGNRLPLMIGGGAILLVIVITLLITFNNSSTGQTNALFDVDKAPIFYVEDDDLYALYPGEDEGVRMIRDFSGFDLVAIDEETFYYLDDSDLYSLDSKGESEEIAQDVISFQVNLDGSKILIIDEDNVLYLYEGNKLEEISDEEVVGTLFADDGNNFLFGYNDKDVVALGVYNGKDVIEVDMEKDETLNDIHGFDDKNIVYSTWNSDDNETKMYRSDDKGKIEELFEFDGYTVYFNEKMNKAIYLDDDSRLYYYDGKETERLSRDIISIYSLSGNTDAYLVKDDDGAYYYYEYGMKEPLELEDSDDSYDMSWTQDGAIFVSTTEDELVIYNPSKKRIKIEEIKIKDIRSIRLSEDGKKAILTDFDNTAYLYQVGKKDATEIIEDMDDYRIGKDYKTVLAVDEDGDLYYFDGKKATRIGEDYLSDLRFAADGKSYIYLDDRYDLYFGKGTKASRVAKDVRSVYTYNMEAVYFIDEDYVLNFYKLGDKEAETLDIDVDRIYTMYDFINY